MTDCSEDTQGTRLSATETLAQLMLHRSASVSIFDVRCRPHDFARGPEEWAEVCQVAFPRHGVFERETHGERAIADSNRVLFFNAGEPYRIAHPAGCGDDCTVFVFDDAALHEALYVADPARAEAGALPFRFAHALSDPRVFMAQEALRSAALTPHVDALAIDEAALRLLHSVMKACYQSHGASMLCSRASTRPARRATQRAHQATAQDACLVLAQRFRESLPLEAIARAVYASPFHLARLFKEQVGLSLHQYRHRLRLREALLRVADGEENLARLALDLGFSSHSHLSDSFRDAFGEPPTKQRKLRGSRALREMSRKLEVPRAGR